MRNTKKFLAVALAATMALGSSVVAFADDNHSSIGTGSNEGHVDKHVVSVTLPTVETGSTPFNYTVDPERLVTATGGTKYGSVDFTENAKANGVYFLTQVAGTDDTYTAATVDDEDAFDAGEFYIADTANAGQYVKATSYDSSASYFTKTDGAAASTKYDSKSDALVTTSQSSAAINLTIEVAAADDGNVTLVNSAPSLTDATDEAQLYLALMVGTDATVIKAGEKVSKTVPIAGVDSNFETTYNATSQKYEYTVIDDPAAWGTASFYLTGVASKSGAENVTVPTLTVTWKYEDPAATPAVTTASISSGATAVESGSDDATAGYTHTLTYVPGTANEIKVSLPAGQSIKSVKSGGSISGASVNASNAKVSDTDSSIVVIPADSSWATGQSGKTKVVVVEVGTDDEVKTTFVVKVSVR